MNLLTDIAEQFELDARPLEIKPLGSGNINRTFLLTTQSGERAVLQQLNPTVFRFPDRIMQNLRLINDHMAGELRRLAPADGRWRLPEIIRTRDRCDYLVAADGSAWRAMTYIGGTVTLERLQSPQLAEQAGAALGRFHRLTHNLDPSRLHDTLPGFHETPRYLEEYDRLGNSCENKPNEAAAYCKAIIEARRSSVSVLENARKAGKLRNRIMHGDPKVSNILFDRESGATVALVDLDTVKPGLILHDIGDFFRSAANPAGEELENPQAATFNLDFFSRGLQGYLSEMTGLMTDSDRSCIFDAVRLMPLELGIRFFSDHLAGNLYFKARYRTQNLDRAVVQFRLCERIDAQEREIRDIVGSMTGQ